MAAAGVDVLVVQHFTPAFAALSAEAFVERFIVERLGAAKRRRRSQRELRAGSGAATRRCSTTLGKRLRLRGRGGRARCASTDHDVSSSAVRRAIAAGDVALAATLLGRPHRLGGRVVHGRQRGAAIGFPTANVARASRDVSARRRLRRPRRSVGERPARRRRQPRDQSRPSALRPRTFEAHLFDFDADLYGERLTRRVRRASARRGRVSRRSRRWWRRSRRDADEARALLSARS